MMAMAAAHGWEAAAGGGTGLPRFKGDQGRQAPQRPTSSGTALLEMSDERQQRFGGGHPVACRGPHLKRPRLAWLKPHSRRLCCTTAGSPNMGRSATHSRRLVALAMAALIAVTGAAGEAQAVGLA
jgi:hypothetical protein